MNTHPLSIKQAAVLVIVGVALSFLVATAFMVASLGAGIAGLPGLTSILSKLGLLIGTALLILPGIVYARRHRLTLQSLFRIRAVDATTILLTILFSIGIVIIIDGIDRMIGPTINELLDELLTRLHPALSSEQILERLRAEFRITSVLEGLLIILAAVVAAGACEELLMRGLFQGSLEKHLRAWKAILISSLVFALIHFNPWGLVQIFVIALALGFVAWVADSVIPTILIHAINNLAAVLFLNLSDQAGTFSTPEATRTDPMLFVVGLGLAITCAAAMYKRRTDRISSL